jgi:SSS family solute:Na+ symporter
VVAIFLLGIFWKRMNRHAAFWTLALGVGVGLVSFVLVEVMQVIQFQFLYTAGILFVLSLLLAAGISLQTEQDSSEQTNMTWDTGYWKEESKELQQLPWYQNYRILSGVLVVASLAVVIMFW